LKNFIKKIISVSMVLAIIFTGVLSFTSIVNADSASGLVAHYKFDGNLNDSSGNNNNGESVGEISYVDAIYGQGLHFDGNSYVDVSDSDSLDLTNAFTFSFWVYKNELKEESDGVPFFAKMNEEGYDCPYGMYEWWRMQPDVFYTSEDGFDDFSSGTKLDIQQWALVSSTYDGSSMKIYINDKMVKSEFVSSTIINSSMPLRIGMLHFMNEEQYFNGTMDDLRIYKKAFTNQEIGALFAAGLNAEGKDKIVKPDSMVAFYRFEGDGNDLSGKENNGTAINAKDGITYSDAIAGKGANFNGSSYFEILNNDSINFDKAFTVGAWIRASSSDYQAILTKYGMSNDYQLSAYTMGDYMSSGGVSFYVYDLQSDEQIDFSSDNPTKVNTWYYYTITYDGKKVNQYINGIQNKSENYDKTIAHSFQPLWIGSDGDKYFNGTMDEIRMYNYALTSAEVKGIYNLRDKLDVKTTANKSVPTVLNVKKTVNLAANFVKYVYTPPVSKNAIGQNSFNTSLVTRSATFKSSNSKILSISKSGSVKALKRGKATLTVTYKKLSQKFVINVK